MNLPSDGRWRRSSAQTFERGTGFAELTLFVDAFNGIVPLASDTFEQPIATQSSSVGNRSSV